jgi:hypothetical protein
MLHYFKFTLILSAMLIVGCANQPNEGNVAAQPTEDATPAIEENVKALSPEFLGNYNGIQPGYNMKNQFGKEMVINGNKVEVPSCDFTFLLKENNVVRLLQINLDNNERVYYEGNYSIISENDNQVTIECTVSDGETSNPTYALTIQKADKRGICSGSNEPAFSVQKIKD